MSPLKATKHAILQLGDRYHVAWGTRDLTDSVRNTGPIFRMSGGAVHPFVVRCTSSGFGYAVVLNERIVTVLTEHQAFVDCPRAVFTFLIRKGKLLNAIGLRSYYKRLSLNPQDENSVRYPKSCDTVWNAFKYLERRTKG